MTAVLAVLVLVLVLSSAAAVTFLLLGWGLRLTGGDPAVARPLVTTGWTCLGPAALSAAASVVALLRTALAHRAPGTGWRAQPTPELLHARDAWLTALRERGIIPFLSNRLATSGTAPGSNTKAPTRDRLMITSPGVSHHRSVPAETAPVPPRPETIRPGRGSGSPPARG